MPLQLVRSRRRSSSTVTRAILGACGACCATIVLAFGASGCDACSSSRANLPGDSRQTTATTLSILAAQSPSCPACAIRNGCLDPAVQGGICELTGGRVPIVRNGVVDGGSPPRDPPPPNAGYTANCLQTLHDTFASHCADSLSLTPCLCGSDQDANAACVEGVVPPGGPLVSDYANSFHSKISKTIQEDFTLPDFGAGRANSIIQCLAAYECRCCFGVDGGGC